MASIVTDNNDNNNNNSNDTINLRKQLTQELKKRRPNLFTIHEIIQKGEDIITPNLRPHLYCSLLRLEKTHIQRSTDALLKKELLTTENDMDNQRTIKADAKRTNASDPYFKKETTRALMENILTFYCKRRSIKYIQGLNFVLAPFLKMLDKSFLNNDEKGIQADDDEFDSTSIGPGAIFELYYAFVNKILPNIYIDEEFKSLQHSFKVFHLLFIYHDPQLCMILDQNDIVPELYATPWFVTCFSRTLPLNALYILWDYYLMELVTDQYPYQHYFVCLAILILNRDKIINCDISELPGVTSKLFENVNIKSPSSLDANQIKETNGSSSPVEFIKKIIKLAQQLRKKTPKTFLKIIYEVSFAADVSNNINGNNNSYKYLKALKFVYDTAASDITRHNLAANHDIIIETSLDILQKALHQLLVLPIQPVEIIQYLQRNSHNKTTTTKKINKKTKAKKVNFDFFLLDCRPKQLYEEKHFAQSFNLDPTLLEGADIEELEAILQSFKEMDGNKHFVFLSNTNDMFIVSRFVLLFLQKGFHYLSACLEGYEKCESLLLNKNGGRADGGLIISTSSSSRRRFSSSGDSIFDEEVANQLFGKKATSMFKNAMSFVSNKVATTSSLTSRLTNMNNDDKNKKKEEKSSSSSNSKDKHNDLECV